jgi:RHS repeat-associated protein
VGYGYTASDDIATLTSPAGTQSYGYDANGRLGQVTTARGTTHFAWEPGGTRLTGIWDSASYEKRCYDGAGRLESVIGADEDAGCPTNLDSLTGVSVYAAFRYTWDARGNPVTEQYLSPLGPPAEGRSYGYDRADRLVGVSYADGSAVLYGLRGDGVRLGEKRFTSYVGDLGGYTTATGATEHHTYGFDARGGLSGVFDQLQGGAQIATYVTDPGGRLTSESWTSGYQRQYGWDADGRLTRITVSNGGSPVTTTYRYDHAGLRRTRIPASGTNTEYLWGAEGLVEERTGATILDYERAGAIVTGVLGATGTNSERIFHDGLESVAARLPSGSTNPITYRFDAWGGFQGAGAPGAGEPSLAYAGHSADTDVGLSYAQQRWYDPRLGRWLSPDPVFGDLDDPMSLHPWGYAKFNPLRWTDPTGERASTKEEAEYIAHLRGIIAKEQAKPWHRRYSMGITAMETYLERYEGAINLALDGQGIAGFHMEEELPVRVAAGGFTSDPHEGFVINTAVEFEPDFENYSVPLEAFDRQPLFFELSVSLPEVASPLPTNVVVDNNILTMMAAGLRDPSLRRGQEALRFAQRRAGRMVVPREIEAEFQQANSPDEWRTLQARFGIRVEDVPREAVQELMRQLGKTSPGEYNDTALVALAMRGRMGIVTGDTGPVVSATRLGHSAVEFRPFALATEAERTAVREKLLEQKLPSNDPSGSIRRTVPWRITGSRIRGPGSQYIRTPRR